MGENGHEERLERDITHLLILMETSSEGWLSFVLDYTALQTFCQQAMGGGTRRGAAVL